MNTILVVDDERNIVQLVSLYLAREGFQVETAADGPTGLKKCQQLKPDLVVLDLMLPGMDGVSVCREIRKESDIPIIMLTARGDDIDKIVGLEVGADDYVTKPFNPRELVARIKAVLRRSQPTTRLAAVIEAGELRIDTARREASVGDKALTLRAKEFDLLAALAVEPGVVLTRDKLLKQVWGYEYPGESRTVDVHVTWLREKLRGGSVSIQTVWGVGYKLIMGGATDSTGERRE